jgi:hypothetical protein
MVIAYFKVLSKHKLERTEENNKKLPPWTKYKNGDPQI